MQDSAKHDDIEFEPAALRPRKPSFHERQLALLIEPRQIIFMEGVGSSPMLRIKSGCVVLSQSFRDGRRQILDILGPGRMFGLPMGPINPYTAEAITLTELDKVAASLRGMIDIDKELRTMLLRAQVHATLLGRKTAQERVASAILDLAQQFSRPATSKLNRKITFTLHLTRADLADWLGLTLETVSRQLNSFKRRGLISFKHPEIVTITNEKALHELASGRGDTPHPTEAGGSPLPQAPIKTDRSPAHHDAAL
jgi:CRP/FNR family transcriptional regulator, anaerobic regulatory protein